MQITKSGPSNYLERDIIVSHVTTCRIHSYINKCRTLSTTRIVADATEYHVCGE